VTFWVLLQVLVNLVLFAAVVILWMKLNRPAKDDPRLSKGLQLLQSKISVLEDLADRTDNQATQLSTLIEQKCREVQNIILVADKQIQKIESSMGKSLEVAKIFQDKIPHQEIIERQNTAKYVKVARLAHQGVSVSEIAAQVDLSMGEIEMIAKLNREQLQFSEEDLPEWAQDEQLGNAAQAEEDFLKPLIKPFHSNFIENATAANKPVDELSQLGNQFRQAMNKPVAETLELDLAPAAPAHSQAKEPMPQAARAQRQVPMPKTATHRKIETLGENQTVRKVVFPKIELNKNLV
jgi:hypothetical protein